MLFKDNRMLFLDGRHIERSENVTLTMNPPVKRGPALCIETEWERQAAQPYSVVEWRGEFRLYYKTTDGSGPALAFAVSTDGVKWTRPDIDLVKWPGAKHNNIVTIDGHHPNEICVFVDPNGPDEHRFKAVMHQTAEGGMYLLTSPDGLSFKRWPGMLLPYHVDNCPTAFFDERLGRYVVYTRGCDKDHPKPPIEGCRSVVRAEAETLFETLPHNPNAPDPFQIKLGTKFPEDGLQRVNKELPVVFECDELDHPAGEIYQLAVTHYLRDVYIGMALYYYRYPWPPEWKYVNDGVLDIQIAASRDGVDWTRDFRDPYIRLDLPDGYATKLMRPLTGMAAHGYRVHHYYMGSRHSHGEGRISRDEREKPDPSTIDRPPFDERPIALRAEQRLDGFVSADSAYTGGTLTTVPFIVESDSLRLNIDTSASGVAYAALLDESGQVIPGFTVDECDRIQGNDTQYPVTWKGSGDISRLKGRSVRLVLKSRSAKLFAVYP